jgi:hypothetical protein
MVVQTPYSTAVNLPLLLPSQRSHVARPQAVKDGVMHPRELKAVLFPVLDLRSRIPNTVLQYEKYTRCT